MTRAGWDARRAEEAADISLGSAQVAVKAAGRAVDAIPRADLRDDPNFQRLAGREQSFARMSPRHKNGWPELVEIDERLDDLDRRQQELHDHLADLHLRRQRADDDYAAAMYVWMEAGKQDPKPTPERQELEEAISEAAAESGAMDLLRQEALAEKIALVERRRPSLVREAEHAVEDAKKQYLDAVDAVERAREEQVGLNEARVWAAVYPSETLATMVPSHRPRRWPSC